MRQQLLSTIAIVLIFASLTLLLTHPVAGQLDSGIAQNPAWSYDAYQQIYELWWFKRALLDLHTNPGYLRWIYFPTGAYYPLILTYSAVYAVGVPFLLFLSPVATYNVIFLLTFFLSGLSAYALCAHLTHNRWAGLLGGVIYAFFPARVAHALSGHLELIATYLFPLYLLLLIKTTRRPRPATALLCGLTLAGSLLVQPLFIPFLLVPTTAIWLLYEAFVLHQQIERRGILALVGAFGLAFLIAAPFFWPVLRQQMTGQGGYLEEIGMVRFSADLLGIISPSPVNPLLKALGLIPTYAHRVAPPDWRIAELLTYAGFVPLGLSALVTVRQRRKVGAWAIIAIIAAILSLGPVLKVNGEVFTFTTDGVESTVALPYALLMHIPPLSLNRGPARINTTLMLALAVLSAHGLSWLMAHLRRRWKYPLASALCILTLGELLTIWPCPTTPVHTPPYLSQMTDSTNQGAVINLPIAAGHVKQLAIFYQTVHHRPVFDSWFQRSLPIFPNVTEFLDGLLCPQTERDIVPTPSSSNRAAVARAEDVSYALLYTPYVAGKAAKMQLLETTLGSPQFVGQGLAIYEVTPGPKAPDDLVYALPNNDWQSLEHGWQYAETWNGRPARWMPTSTELYIYAPGQRRGALQFVALPFSTPQRLELQVNQRPLTPLVIGEWITYTTPSFILEPGLNQISLRALNGCHRFTGDPRCSGVVQAVTHDSEPKCAPHLDDERCLSVLLQDIRFLDTDIAPASHPLGLDLGDRVRLLGYDLSGNPGPGQDISLTLYWQALRSMTEDYVIFVHLLGPDGNLLAQHDAPPFNNVYPTSKWVIGDIYTHPASLHIPSDALPGQYELLTGMYTYPDLARLSVASNRPHAPHAENGLIWLQSVDIAKP